VASIYRSGPGREAIRSWCFEQLSHWPESHETTMTTANGASTHAVLAGTGAAGPSVVLVPGTNFNAASSLPLASAWRNTGAPFLSTFPDSRA